MTLPEKLDQLSRRGGHAEFLGKPRLWLFAMEGRPSCWVRVERLNTSPQLGTMKETERTAPPASRTGEAAKHQVAGRVFCQTTWSQTSRDRF